MERKQDLKERTVTYLRDYRPPVFVIPATRLEFDLEPDCTVVKSVMQFHRLSESGGELVDRSLSLQGERLQLLYVKLDDRLLSVDEYRVDQSGLVILSVPDNFILELAVKIDPESNTTCSGLYLSGGIFCTQNEPHGFRRITYFLDRPDVLTKVTTVIRADAERYPTLLSNGNMVEYRLLPHGRHQVTWYDPFNKSCYLFALVAGKLGCLEGEHCTPSGRSVQLRIYAAPERIEQARFALQSLQRAMQWDEQNFGLECDLDLYQIVAIDDFNFGAMENKGLNIFNSRVLLASPANAVDSDWRNIARVVAHEYFHNWTGNRVTCRDWFQIGLKEGLTTLREQLFMEDSYGPEHRIDSVSLIRDIQFKEDAGPLAHPVRLASYLEVNNFYTATVYEKSAELFRMLITLTGRAGFRQVLTEFLAQLDGQAATISDFWRVAAKMVKFKMNDQIEPNYAINVSQLEAWYDRAGTPEIVVSSRLTADGKLEVLLEQHGADVVICPLIIPFNLEILDSAHSDSRSEVLLLTKQRESFLLPFTGKVKPSIAYLSGFSAPVKLQGDCEISDLVSIIKESKDPVNRWLAMQELISQVLDSFVNHEVVVERLVAPLVDGYRELLMHAENAGELVVRSLVMPAVSYLAELFAGRYDLLAIDRAVRRLQRLLGEMLYDQWLELYRYSRRGITAEYSIEAQQCNLRALSQVALHYLLATGRDGSIKLADAQLHNSNNLTDRYAVLNSVVYWRLPIAHAWLADCYEEWSQDEQLFSKWLSLKGRILNAHDREGWQLLYNDANFNWRNPNKVLALLRSFCTNNLSEFHAADGAGYRLLVQAILRVDAINPQIAALLAGQLTSICGLTSTQITELQSSWRELLAHTDLSSNVYELVDKAERSLGNRELIV